MSKRDYTAREIANATDLCLKGINNIESKTEPTVLTEENQRNVMSFFQIISNKDQLNPSFRQAIETGQTIYYNEHPEKQVISSDLTRTAELQVLNEQNGPTRTLTKKEVFPLTKAGFVNVAILLYGTLNIGIILAIAFMK